MLLPLWVFVHTEPWEVEEHVLLLPLPLAQRDLHVSQRESPYGDHRSEASTATHDMHEVKKADGVFMHIVVCLFLVFTAGDGAPRLRIEKVCARGTVPATVALRVTA